jgi:hypothetical protein
MLNAFVHDLKLVLAQWSVNGEKSNEPTVLRHRLSELLTTFPLLKLIAGDALFAQRPLAEALWDENRDYLARIKGTQPDVLDAVQVALGDARQRSPAAESIEKRGLHRSPARGGGPGQRRLPSPAIGLPRSADRAAC